MGCLCSAACEGDAVMLAACGCQAALPAGLRRSSSPAHACAAAWDSPSGLCPLLLTWMAVHRPRKGYPDLASGHLRPRVPLHPYGCGQLYTVQKTLLTMDNAISIAPPGTSVS